MDHQLLPPKDTRKSLHHHVRLIRLNIDTDQFYLEGHVKSEHSVLRFSCVLYGNSDHAGTWFWKGLAGRFESFPVVRKMMFVRLRRDLNPLALTMAA